AAQSFEHYQNKGTCFSSNPNHLDSAFIKERCRVEEGEDWYKINRIPKIEIDSVQIPMVARKA
ncbi:hypothetical protein ACH5RR_003228, partial [Cinchona calisaya]